MVHEVTIQYDDESGTIAVNGPSNIVIFHGMLEWAKQVWHQEKAGDAVELSPTLDTEVAEA